VFRKCCFCFSVLFDQGFWERASWVAKDRWLSWLGDRHAVGVEGDLEWRSSGCHWDGEGLHGVVELSVPEHHGDGEWDIEWVRYWAGEAVRRLVEGNLPLRVREWIADVVIRECEQESGGAGG